MTGDYKLIYDVTQEWPQIWFPAFGLVFVALGVLFVRFDLLEPLSRRGPWRDARKRMVFNRVWLGFSIVWTLGAAAAVFGGTCAARHAMRSGDARVVEGVVQEFRPDDGHNEEFWVNGVRFVYSEATIGPGYHVTSAYGGPIREGLAVRIHFTGGRQGATILRLEVRE